MRREPVGEQLEGHFVDPARGDCEVPVGDYRLLVTLTLREEELTLSAEARQELDVQSAFGVVLANDVGANDLGVVGEHFVGQLAELLNVSGERRSDGQKLHGDLAGPVALGGSTLGHVVDRSQVGNGHVRVAAGLSV